ncbi:hypothetical protein SAY86_012289 [Trapa natans]|uniref:Uncharacterized protein n=1 Tax=Trapa natans TaxID=22666 RepID=A0AAN7LWW6_TRANT|nr:hypothetical protein SAY86_012289 [Trapa natans]
MSATDGSGGPSKPNNSSFTNDEQDISNKLPRLWISITCRKYPSPSLSSSDVEVEYQRGRSVREGRGD